MLGDYNAHPGESFANELLTFCTEQSWSCVDLELLPSDSHTFVSDAHGCQRWLDHCIVTSAARHSVSTAEILYNTYWSDHYPVSILCNFNLVKPMICIPTVNVNKMVWGDRELTQIAKFETMCHTRLREIDFPSELRNCSDNMCNEISHKMLLDNMCDEIICILSEAAVCSYDVTMKRRGKYITGWNRHVRDATGGLGYVFKPGYMGVGPRLAVFIMICVKLGAFLNQS
jgi:hypothetical protein